MLPRFVVRCPSIAALAVTVGCSSSGSSPFGADAGADAPAADARAETGVDPMGCARAGGQCGCVGACNPGYRIAPAPLADQCPQPCPECGGCSQQCCLPDALGDSGFEAGCTGSFNCLCGEPTCIDGQWECVGGC